MIDANTPAVLCVCGDKDNNVAGGEDSEDADDRA